MGNIKKPERVMLVVGLLYTDADAYARVRHCLEHKYGSLTLLAEPIPFTHTQYYVPEMGEGIQRVYGAFERLIHREKLADIKRYTNTVEQRFSRNGKRCVNIDPGYLDLSKLVLASTKDYAHRIYIGKGIHAEITLLYQKGTFTAVPWTYPDYKDPVTIRLFNELRGRFKQTTDNQ